MTSTGPISPVEGKFVFQMDANIRVRFNADGWVEEMGKGGEDDAIGTRLQGHGGSRLDDTYARRFYDLYMRVVIFDIHPKRSSEQAISAGLIKFSDLEAGTQGYERVSKVIEIANRNFNMNIKPLS